MTKTKYAIKFGGRLVSGFSNVGQGMVQFAQIGGTPKLFATQAKAIAYLEKYADAGYGIEMEGSEIVSI